MTGCGADHVLVHDVHADVGRLVAQHEVGVVVEQGLQLRPGERGLHELGADEIVFLPATPVENVGAFIDTIQQWRGDASEEE